MMEEILDRKYQRFIERKVSHFSDLRLNINHYTNFSTKDALKEIKVIEAWNKHEKVLVIDRDTFLKGITPEIIGLKERVNKQLVNAKSLNLDFDYTWKFVTEYYLSFFIILTLTRINGEYSTFIYKEEAENISEIASTIEGEPLKLNEGQYILKISKIDYEHEEVKVELRPKRDAHATGWQLFNRFLNQYRELSGKKDTIEDNIMAVLQDFFNEQPNVLSTARNDLNYKHLRGFDDKNLINLYEVLKWEDTEEQMISLVLKLSKPSNIEDSVKSIVVINNILYYLLNNIFSQLYSNIKFSNELY